ncbi:MAG: pyridoxamine 5'-phosphate oxidase [Patescibacteria group bacterium]|nr:MAG: pyridoxamine 5'-phosphate oxidase [Patescibacteria group bacterium]
MKKENILAFIRTKIHAVISTCGDSHSPEAALIGFGETNDFELVFGTFTTSKKYKNLQENPKVALVIGWDEEYITVQYEGIATEIFGQEREKLVELYHKKVPSAAGYHNHPEQTYFKIIPTWVRYSDLSGEEDKIYEFDF